MTDYELVGGLRKGFEPYSNLWATADGWVCTWVCGCGRGCGRGGVIREKE
jgi:hypothetical protein